MSKTIAYLRTSTKKQDLRNQELEIRRYAQTNKIKNVEYRKISISSRKDTKKRGIDQLKKDLNEGDLLIVSELSRLGRSISQITRLVDDLIKKKVNLICINENIKAVDGEMDTDMKIKIGMFSLMAEIERDLISKRTKEGINAKRAKAKALGEKFKIGRPKGSGKSKLDNHKEEIEALLKNGSTKAHIAKKYSISTPALYNWLKKHNIG